MVEKMPLCPEERALSYCKYFDLPMEEPDPRSMQIWNAGPVPEETVLRIENINDLFKPGYLPCEQGYCALSDGTGFVANYVRMEGVTAEMVGRRQKGARSCRAQQMCRTPGTIYR